MRYASIDVGSNSVLLLIATFNEQGILVPLFEKIEITRLGEGLQKTGELQPEAMHRTLKALLRFTHFCHQHLVERIVCVGTEALRAAKNAVHFIKQVKEQCGFSLKVISGEKEAELAYLSAWKDFGDQHPHLVVLDIGGGSTELIWKASVSKHVPALQTFSIKIGSVRLTERFLHHDPILPEEYEQLVAYVNLEILQSLQKFQIPQPPFQMVGLAGTVTTLAALDQKQIDYNSKKIQGSKLSRESVENLILRMRTKTIEERKKMPGMEPKRADVLLAGAVILEQVLKKFDVSCLLVSDHGIRYGALYQWFHP